MLSSMLAGCGDDGETAPTDKEPSTTDDDDAGTGKMDAGANSCTTEGKTASCTCASGRTGTHTCKNGAYGLCACGGASDAGAVFTAPKCKAGYYTGNFMGSYRPGAFGLGLFGSNFQVDISGGKSFFDDTLPPLAFTLSEEYGGTGEFQTYKVGGGCLQGLATAVVITQSPFVARLTGDLNCKTGEFTGKLEGYYTLIGIPGADYSFSGPVSGSFNLDTAKGDGDWMVSEPNALDGTPQGGGEGVWNATWQQADTPMLAAYDPCWDVGPGGAHMPGAGAPDAGTLADAGSP